MTRMRFPSLRPNGLAMNAALTSRPKIVRSWTAASESMSLRLSIDDVGDEICKSLA